MKSSLRIMPICFGHSEKRRKLTPLRCGLARNGESKIKALGAAIGAKRSGFFLARRSPAAAGRRRQRPTKINGALESGASDAHRPPPDLLSPCGRFRVTHFMRRSRRSRGGIGRRVRLRTVWGNPWRFESSREHDFRKCPVIRNEASRRFLNRALRGFH